MSITSIGQTKIVIPEFDLSTVPLPWREDFVKLQKRIEHPKNYMTDKAAMALGCLLVSQRLSVPLSTILGSRKQGSAKPRAIAYYVCEPVLTWQDKSWMCKYFKKHSNWHDVTRIFIWSDKEKRIIREVSKEFGELLVKIYKSY